MEGHIENLPAALRLPGLPLSPGPQFVVFPLQNHFLTAFLIHLLLPSCLFSLFLRLLGIFFPLLC